MAIQKIFRKLRVQLWNFKRALRVIPRELFFKIRQQLILFKNFLLHSKKRSSHSAPLKIKCFCQVKNEADIIEDWIRYHLNLFGEKNLHIIDNGSTDSTLDILQKLGQKIHVTHATNDFIEKGRNLSAEMHKYKNECDLMIPLDADEFICLENTAHKESILKEFQKLDLNGWGKFKMQNQFLSAAPAPHYEDPLCEIIEFKKQADEYIWKKVFFAAPYFKRTDQGNHWGHSEHPNPHFLVTSIWIAHFEFRGLEHMRRKCLDAAKAFNYWKSGEDCGSPTTRTLYKSLQEKTFEKKAPQYIPKVNKRIDWLAEEIKRLRKNI